MVTAENEEKEVGVPAEQIIQGSSKSSAQEHPEEAKKIEQLWADGFKLYVAQDFEAAAEKLSEATELSVGLFGQFAPQGFQLHYYYGQTMVEIARAESLIVKPPAEEDESDSSDNEEEEEKVNIVADAEQKKKLSNGEVGNGVESKEQENGATELNDAKPEELDADQTLKSEKAADDEDGECSTTSIAWESLEVARKICDNQEQTAEWLEKRADVLIALGECMIVEENFEKASEELNNALVIRKSLFPPHDRRIAETLFHIGLNYKNADEYLKAAETFEKAVQVFKKTIEHAEKEASGSADPAAAAEIENLKKICGEMEEQVQDARDSAHSREEQLAAQKTVLQGVFSQILSQGATSGEGDITVNDITNMVRKRPAPEVQETPKKGNEPLAENQVEVEKAADEMPSEKKAKLE